MSPPRFALDTNVLVYAEGILRATGDGPKVELSRSLMRGLLLARAPPIASVQVLGELHRVLTRKGGVSQREAESRVRRLMDACDIREITASIFAAAMTLSTDHRLRIFDAMILAAAAEAGAEILLSEDLKDGFTWRGLTVRNPFAAEPDARISQALIPTAADCDSRGIPLRAE